jgi:para-aminobenzoate synthetase
MTQLPSSDLPPGNPDIRVLLEQKMFDLSEACSQIVAAINQLAQGRQFPILVALDGGSGAGKSTLASMLGRQLDCVVVQLDDFFAANIPDWEWDSFSMQERATKVFDWQRVRAEALEPLLARKAAKWHPFDFAAGLRRDGTYAMSQQKVEKEPASVILLEGAYSSHPQLADLIDLKVLIDVPITERHRRLEERENDKQFLKRWHLLWDNVEKYYFEKVMPKSSFDLVVTGT